MIKRAQGSIFSLLICLVIGGLLLPIPVCFAGPKEDVTQRGDNKNSGNEVEISVFTTKDEAEKLAEKIRSGGFETFVRRDETKGNKTVYGVFVIIHAETTPETQIKSPAGSVESRTSTEAERPLGTKKTSRDTLSRLASYIRASMTLSEIYTDNAFNTKTDKKNDLSTLLSPEVSIVLPSANEKPLSLDLIDPRAAGGLSLTREKGEETRRFQAFLRYQSDIPIHSQNSPSGNMVTYNVQGGFSYSFPFGLSLEVNDEFSRYYETPDVSTVSAPGEVDQYKSNLFYALLSYDTGSRVRLRFDYSHFLLNYDAQSNTLRNRIDNSFSTYIFYRLRPKTSLFFEYAFTDIGYTNDTTLDSKEQNFFVGVEWKMTAKSKGSIKAGYGLRDFSDSGTNNNKTFIFEGKLAHQFTPKTSLTVIVSRRMDETNIPSTFFVITDEADVQYQQMLTPKITGSLTLGYTRDSYGADLTFGSMTAKRVDNLYRVSLGLQYEFRKWLRGGISYIYTIRNSNFPDFNYSNNTIWLRLTGSI